MDENQAIYRNSEPIGDIDADSLWELKEDQFVLVDDDQYIALPWLDYNHLFYQVEN